MLRIPFLGALAVLGASLPGQTLTTTFVGGLTTSVGAGVHFDLTVLNPAGVLISRINLNANFPGWPGTVEVYLTARGGTYFGNELNRALWTRVATASVQARGVGLPTPALLSPAIRLGPGTYGVTICHLGIEPIYTTGTATNQTYSNADLRLDLGSVNDACFSGTLFQPRVANLQLVYSVSTGTHARFAATPTSGSSPLAVSFTDQSFTNDPGGVVIWLWDLDNDGTVDSMLQNPTHTYTAGCRNYTVRLTAISGSGQDVVTRTDYIQVDPLRVDFLATPDSGPAPLSVSFLDRTVPTPTAWAWDFDGDGVVDSTARNPSFTFPHGCFDATLSVQACGMPVSATRRIFASPNVSSGFSGLTSLSTPDGAMFMDLQVSNPEGIEVCGFDVKLIDPEGTPFSLEVYLTPGSYAGKTQQSSPWRRVATGPGVAGVVNGPSRGRTSSFFLLPGSYGLALRYLGASPEYTTNASLMAGNGDLQLSNGAAQLAPLFGGTLFSPRMWNGTIHYTLCSQAGRAAYGFLGYGCPGSVGITRLETAVGSRPVLGTTFRVRIINMPAVSAGIMLVGLSSTSSIFGPLPLDTGFLGMPGCLARVSPDASMFVVGTGGIANWGGVFPNNPSLRCAKFFNQVLVLDPGVNPLGAVLSDAAVGVVGAQ